MVDVGNASCFDGTDRASVLVGAEAGGCSCSFLIPLYVDFYPVHKSVHYRNKDVKSVTKRN